MTICECGHCTPEITHASDCAVHSVPALPVGQCSCGAATDQDERVIAAILATSDAKILSHTAPGRIKKLRDEIAAAAGASRKSLQEVIREDLADCSTVDFYDISPEGIDNLALIAAQAVEKARRRKEELER